MERSRLPRLPSLPGGFATVLAAIATLTAAAGAWAGRERIVADAASTVPPTPEPGAALAFGVGIGVVAWAVRRHRRGRR